MELTAEQRDRIRRLLERELRAAVRSAAALGARPADVAALVADRRRRLAALRPGLGCDSQDAADDDGDGGGVRKQR